MQIIMSLEALDNKTLGRLLGPYSAESMLGPIQRDAYRWDGIINYSLTWLYEVCTTLQLIWEQTNGHHHDRLYVDQDHTELVRLQTKDGSILEDVRVVDMLKEQS